MRIIVEEAVFVGDRGIEHHADLISLFRLGLGRRHTVEVEPSESKDFSRWLAQESELTKRMCNASLDAGVKQRARRRRARAVRVADVRAPLREDVPRLSLSQALRILQRPLGLLLENGRNDRHFLRVITQLAEGFNLNALIAEGSVEVKTNGGIDENAVYVHQLEPEDAQCLWAMCDSDALSKWPWPGDGAAPPELGSGAQKLKKVCAERGVPLHILKRRAIENYVPLPLLERWSYQDQSAREMIYSAVASLTDEQRHYYNMKSGFSKSRDKQYVSTPGNIYEGLDHEVRQHLENGLNTRHLGVAELFDEKKAQSELGLHLVTRWFLQDGQATEGQRIAQLIRELL